MGRVISRAVLICGLLLGSSLSLSEEEAGAPAAVVLSSGVEGGGYWNAGVRLQAVAAKEVALGVENLPSAGSLENLARLLDKSSPVNLAFAQADALQLYLGKHPEEFENLSLLENIGQECVFVVTSADSAMRTDADMHAAKNLRLGIASADSGIAVTFEYMASQVPELADVTVTYADTLAAMKAMGTDSASVDAVMMVHRPRELSAEVKYALANPDRFRFLQLSDERFTESQWNSKKIYRTMDLAMSGMDEPLQTVCVLGLLLANKHKLSSEQRIQLGNLMDYHWMQVYPTE